MKRIVFLGFSLLCFCILFVYGCGEGISSSSPVAATSPLSPSISSLIVSGNSISKKTGGILKIGCSWASPEAVGSATGFLSYVQTLNASDSGPTGIIGPTTGSGTSSASPAKILVFHPLHTVLTEINFQSTASGTASGTASDTSLASGTVATSTSGTASGTASDTAATATATATADGSSLFEATSAPLAIPTGVTTSQLSGGWNVEIPFPASSLANTAIGKKQMLFWMVLNTKKTNTLAFEIDITQ